MIRTLTPPARSTQDGRASTATLHSVPFGGTRGHRRAARLSGVLLWLYALPGNGGVNPRVQVGSGWGRYPRIIGAGDRNGEGHGDLLGVDGTGVMYRYFGDGKGRFGRPGQGLLGPEHLQGHRLTGDGR